MKIFNQKYDLPGWEEPEWHTYEFQPDMSVSNHLLHPAMRLEIAAGTINLLETRIKNLQNKLNMFVPKYTTGHSDRKETAFDTLPDDYEVN